MREYFVTVFILSVLVGFLEKFLYKESGAFGERSALAVILIFAVASPLPSLISANSGIVEIPDFGIHGEATGEYEEVTKEALEEGLCKQIAEEFSIDPGSIAVRCIDFSFGEMKAGKISVILSISAGTTDPKRVEKYVTGLGLGECEVQFEIR